VQTIVATYTPLPWLLHCPCCADCSLCGAEDLSTVLCAHASTSGAEDRLYSARPLCGLSCAALSDLWSVEDRLYSAHLRPLAVLVVAAVLLSLTSAALRTVCTLRTCVH